MDFYNIFTKIPYIIMLGVGLTLVLQVYVGVLSDYTASIDDNVEPANDVLTVTETIHSVGEDNYRSEVDFESLDSGAPCSTDDIPGIPERDLNYRVFPHEDNDLDLNECDNDNVVGTSVEYSYSTRILIIDEEGSKIPATLEVYSLDE